MLKASHTSHSGMANPVLHCLSQLSDIKENQKQLQFMDLRPKGKEGEWGMHACAWVEMAGTYPETYFHALCSDFQQSLVPRNEETFFLLISFSHIGILQSPTS